MFLCIFLVILRDMQQNPLKGAEAADEVFHKLYSDYDKLLASWF